MSKIYNLENMYKVVKIIERFNVKYAVHIFVFVIVVVSSFFVRLLLLLYTVK